MKTKPEGNIFFRKLADIVGPDQVICGTNWQVEYNGGRDFPEGLVWVAESKVRTFVKYIFVVDENRRRGIASALLEACRQRWPDLDLGDGVTNAGEGLLAVIETRWKGR